jgi:hypothetical protein
MITIGGARRAELELVAGEACFVVLAKTWLQQPAELLEASHWHLLISGWSKLAPPAARELAAPPV